MASVPTLRCRRRSANWSRSGHSGPTVQLLRLYSDLPAQQIGDGKVMIELGDLYAQEQRKLLMGFQVPGGIPNPYGGPPVPSSQFSSELRPVASIRQASTVRLRHRRNRQYLWMGVFRRLVDHFLVDLDHRGVRRVCR